MRRIFIMIAALIAVGYGAEGIIRILLVIGFMAIVLKVLKEKKVHRHT